MNEKQIELIIGCFDIIKEDEGSGYSNSAIVGRHILEMKKYNIDEKIINAFLNVLE